MTVQGPQHRRLSIDAIIGDVEIIALKRMNQQVLESRKGFPYPREHVLIYKMKSTLLRSRALPVACLNEATKLYSSSHFNIVNAIGKVSQHIRSYRPGPASRTQEDHDSLRYEGSGNDP